MSGGKRLGLLCLLAAALYLFLSGCTSDLLPEGRDITHAKLMSTLTLEQRSAGELEVTVWGEGQEEDKPDVLRAQAGSLFPAMIRLEHMGEGYPEFGHLEHCVIGESLAKAGINGVLDYLERDFSVRMETNIFLRSDPPAQQEEDTHLTQRLDAIARDHSAGGRHWPYTLRELISDLEDNGCALLPMLTQEEGELTLSALGVLQEGRLALELTKEESRGTALLLERDQLDGFSLPLPGGEAGVRLVCAQSRVRGDFDPDSGALVGITVELEVKGDLNEVRGDPDPEREADRNAMEQAFFRELERLGQKAVERSQVSGLDFLHLRRTLQTRYPLRAGQLQNEWEERFPQLSIKVTVTGALERSYNVGTPRREGG